MYLTAHRVVAPDGTQGTNAYGHLHLEDPLPRLGGVPDLDKITTTAPGTCVETREQVQSGGNSVECELDVAGQDDLSKDCVDEAIEELRKGINHASLPVSMASTRVAARFGATFRLEEQPESLAAAFEELAAQVVSLHSRTTRRKKAGKTPLVVWVRFLPDGMELSLPSTSRARLKAGVLRHVRVLLPSDVVAMFPGGGRAAMLETAAVLAGRTRTHVAGRGVVFVDPVTEETVLEVGPASG